MGEEKIIIKAGPVGIVLGSRSEEDMRKLRFLVTLAGAYEYVKDGTLRLLCCEKKKDADAAMEDSEARGQISLIGSFNGKYFLATDQIAALHLLKKYGNSFMVVDGAQLTGLLQEAAVARDVKALRKYQKLQKPAYVGTEVKPS